MSLAHRALALLLRPFRRLARGDAWTRFDYAVPSAMFGHGSTHDFRWYFGGESEVAVESVEEICDWLATCEYASDAALFHEADFWQHPKTFETLRKGDCEDHALWAWRKLVELGLDAELMIGTWTPRGGKRIQHAWVVFHRDGGAYVLETVRKQREGMILPLADVRAQYEPMFSVDQSFKRCCFRGYLRHVESLVSGRASLPEGDASQRPVIVTRDS